MSSASLQIVYDGQALESHEMEVRDLAPALLAMGDLFEEANNVLNKGKAKIAVNVKGSFKTGCFAIDLTVVQHLLDSVRDFFNGENVTAALNIVEVVGLAGSGVFSVFKLIKWVNGRKITKVTICENNTVKIYCDNDMVEVEKEVLDLFRSYKLRKAFEQVIYVPLQKQGIDYFAVRDTDTDFISITKEESKIFLSPDQEEEVIEENNRIATLQLVNISFREENKWRFYDGASTFYASIADKDFIHRVENNEESFSKGDLLKVDLIEKKFLSGDSLRTEYIITKVINHRAASIQLKMPIE